MGQYYLIVNPIKRQFLNPHKFGCGLKLMEFSQSEYGPQQALTILLANGNGRGGGDLETRGMTDEEKAVIGSWAGDPVIVAGDYGDPWAFVPEDLKGQEYDDEEYVHGYNGPTRKVKVKFGTRKDRETGKYVPCDETLYNAARCFFEDISDKVIAIVAKGESGYHPWACIDTDKDGWRNVPQWGVLPETEPKKPVAGRDVYNEYAKQAKPLALSLVDDIDGYLMRNPDQVDIMLGLIKQTAQKHKQAAAGRGVKQKRNQRVTKTT